MVYCDIVYSMISPFKNLNIIKGLSFFKKPQNVLGIDIGSSSIKVVQLRKEKERAVLETYGEIALGPYGNLAVGQAARLSEEKAIEALKDVLKESNAKAKKAAVAIPLKSSFITIINIPMVDGKDAAQMIEMEARRYIPVPISEVDMDWWILPETVEKKINKDDQGERRKFIKVLLVAIHKDSISKYREIIAKAGPEISVLEIESFSAMRASVGRESSPAAVIDFGASSVKMAIVDFGIMMASHSVTKGSQDLTGAIAHSLGVDFERAEEMKREIGLSPLPEHKEIRNIVEPILDYVFMEVSRVIKEYQRKNGRAVSKVILTGGGSLLKGMAGFAVKRLSLEAALADPFAKTEYPAFLAEALKEAGPSFSVSIGLALRGLQ